MANDSDSSLEADARTALGNILRADGVVEHAVGNTRVRLNTLGELRKEISSASRRASPVARLIKPVDV